jgi:solute:Na+ symporter, SSS family
MIVGGMIVVLFSVVADAGGWNVLWAKTQSEPETFRCLPHNNPKEIVAYIAAWLTVGFGSVPQQDVFMRIMSAKSEKTAVWGAYLSGLMYLTVGLIPIIIAYCGKIMYPELLEGTTEQRQMLIPKMVQLHSSMTVQVFFYGALMSAVLSTASGAILAPSTVIGENIIKNFYPNLTDKQLLSSMRWSVVGVTIVSVIFTTFDQSIYELVRQSSEISLVALFIPMVAGLYWKKTSSFGAMASMIGGLGSWLFLIVLHNHYGVETMEKEFHWMVGSDFSPMVIGSLVSLSALLIGTFAKPRHLENKILK